MVCHERLGACCSYIPVYFPNSSKYQSTPHGRTLVLQVQDQGCVRHVPLLHSASDGDRHNISKVTVCDSRLDYQESQLLMHQFTSVSLSSIDRMSASASCVEGTW